MGSRRGHTILRSCCSCWLLLPLLAAVSFVAQGRRKKKDRKIHRCTFSPFSSIYLSIYLSLSLFFFLSFFFRLSLPSTRSLLFGFSFVSISGKVCVPVPAGRPAMPKLLGTPSTALRHKKKADQRWKSQKTRYKKTKENLRMREKKERKKRRNNSFPSKGK